MPDRTAVGEDRDDDGKLNPLPWLGPNMCSHLAGPHTQVAVTIAKSTIAIRIPPIGERVIPDALRLGIQSGINLSHEA